MQDSLTSTDGTQLQPQGSTNVQSGQGGLQPQVSGGATTQSRSTGQPQQEVLTPQDYPSFSGLKVQTGPASPKTQAAVGKGSSEVFFILFFVLLACALIILRRYMLENNKKAPVVNKDTSTVLAEEPKIVVTQPVKKHTKKQTSKNKVVKKTKSKKKKK